MSRPTRAPRIDGELTRVRLLDAAGELFAAHGPADTTGKAIAALAGADLASINYHFGSRKGLYQAVLVEAHRRWITLRELEEIAASGLAPAGKLHRLVERVVAGSADGPAWHLRVLGRELLAQSEHLRALLRDEVEPKFRFVRRIIGEVTGIPEDDPALLPCVLGVVAPCALLLVVDPGLPSPLQPLLRGSRAALAEDLHVFLLAGLRGAGLAYAASGTRARARRRR